MAWLEIAQRAVRFARAILAPPWRLPKRLTTRFEGFFEFSVDRTECTRNGHEHRLHSNKQREFDTSQRDVP
jgi:hypothetical protein